MFKTFLMKRHGVEDWFYEPTVIGNHSYSKKKNFLKEKTGNYVV